MSSLFRVKAFLTILLISNYSAADTITLEYLYGNWCEYGVGLKIGENIDTSSPVNWEFNRDGTMMYSGVPTSYKIENNVLITGNALIGNWTLHEMKSDHLILAGPIAGYNYYKRGKCELNEAIRKEQEVIEFHNAIVVGKTATVAEYLAKGMDPNVKNMQSSHESTPLHVAVKFNQSTIVKMLLENGANPNTVDFLGETPLVIAKKQNNSNIVILLQEYGAK